jgi:hypothetical protein
LAQRIRIGLEDPAESRKEMVKFGLTMGAALPILFGLFFPLVFKKKFPIWPWYAASGFVLAALLFPAFLRLIHTPWMKFAHVLGYINTRILLGVVYFVVVVPLGFLKRTFGGEDAMARKLDPTLPSYRVKRPETKAQTHMERPF